MNFLKKLFAVPPPQNPVQHFYVRPRGCPDVIQVRINTYNDLTLTDDFEGYFINKTVSGAHRCFNRAELQLRFDKQRTLLESTVVGGELVEQADYEAWQLTLESSKTGNP